MCPVARAATTASTPMAAPVRTAAGTPEASIASAAGERADRDAGVDGGCGKGGGQRRAGTGEGDHPVLDRGRHAHGEETRADDGDGGDHRVPAEEPHRGQRDGHADAADDQGTGGVRVGEATTGIRADRRCDAVGEQVGADGRAGHAGDGAQEGHEVGQRGLDRGEDQERPPRGSPAPAARTPLGPGRPPGSRATSAATAARGPRRPARRHRRGRPRRTNRASRRPGPAGCRAADPGRSRWRSR